MPTYSYRSDASVCVLSAAAPCDANEELLGRVCASVKASGAEALVVCPSASAREALKSRLAQRAGEELAGVEFVTSRDLALGILDCDEAFEACGRRAHVLNKFELAFLHEDVRVTGKRGRRVNEMLKFFARGWSELSEEEEGWLISSEERSLNVFVKERLAFLEALHPAEVEAVCVRFLASSPAALERSRHAQVFVADARSMCRSAQILACMLAGRELTVAWNADAALMGDGPYAYDGGLDELLADNPNSTVVTLDEPGCSRAVSGVVQNLLRARNGVDAGTAKGEASERLTEEGTFEVVEAPTLADEMGCVVDAVRSRIDAGVDVSDVFVATPSDAWTRRAALALEAAGVPCCTIEERQVLSCDVRDTEKSAAAMAYTAIALAADPTSAIAWRAWCGFGDYLTHSAGFSTMYERAQQSGMSVVSFLEAMASGVDAGDCGGADLDGAGNASPNDANRFGLGGSDCAKIVGRYRDAMSFIEDACDKTGMDLVRAACRAATGSDDVPAALAALLGEVGHADGARELYARAQRALLDPVYSEGVVCIGSWERLLGRAPRTVVFCGMVNGLVPERGYFDATQTSIDARAKMRDRLIGRLIAAVSHVASDVVCTTFAKAGLVEAETLKLDSERIQLVEGRRVCRISPSVTVSLMRDGSDGRN